MFKLSITVWAIFAEVTIRGCSTKQFLKSLQNSQEKTTGKLLEKRTLLLRNMSRTGVFL